MSAQRTQTTSPITSPSSVLDVLTDSINVVLANMWVLIIPLVLDAAYVVGRQINVAPALDSTIDRLDQATFTGSERLASIVDTIAGVDLTAMFAMVLPTMFGGADSDGTYDPVVSDTVVIGSPMVAALAVAVIFVLTALIYGLFGLWLADVGLNRNRSWSERFRSLPATSVRIAGVFALGIGVVLILAMPLLLAWGATSVAGLDLQSLFVPVIVIMATCVLVLFYFAPEAVFVAGASPARALRLSARVVRGNGWTTLGFIGATTLISWGLSDLWARLASNAPGLLLAMAGSALAGSALALAGMKFFNERLLSLEHDEDGRSGAHGAATAA
ncbi:MAG: hypothetical protein AB7V46_09150 [Thermomicrobiales bacterium]